VAFGGTVEDGAANFSRRSRARTGLVSGGAFALGGGLFSAAASREQFMARLLRALMCALMLAGCGAAERELPCGEDRRCLRYAISADIPVLDPHISDLPEAGLIFRQIYDTLVYRDADSGQLSPGLATNWEVSQDGLAYTFQLRQDVAFHDGSAFTAQSVAHNIERIFLPESGPSLARELLGPLRQFEVLDEFTIRFRLYEPHAALLDGLAQPYLGIASPEALMRYDGLRYQYHQSGTGPFMVADYLPGDRIVLRRFEGYSTDPSVHDQLAGGEIDRIEFSIIHDSDASPLALVGSSLDVIDDVSPAAAQVLTGNSRVMLRPTEIPGLAVQFIFNTNRLHIAERDVRLALLLATNRIEISDQVYFNISPVAWAPLSESTGYAHTGYVGEFEFDLVQAQAILQANGYADSDDDGILDKFGAPLALTILVPPWEQLPDVAALLQEQWRQIGIDLRVEAAAGKSQLAALIQSGAYDLLPAGNYGRDPAILNRVFLNDSLYAHARAQHAALEARLVSAAQEQDPRRRRNQYYEIQALLMNEALLLPIRDFVRLRAISANVGGLRYDAYGFYPILFNVSLSAG